MSVKINTSFVAFIDETSCYFYQSGTQDKSVAIPIKQIQNKAQRFCCGNVVYNNCYSNIIEYIADDENDFNSKLLQILPDNLIKYDWKQLDLPMLSTAIARRRVFYFAIDPMRAFLQIFKRAGFCCHAVFDHWQAIYFATTKLFAKEDFCLVIAEYSGKLYCCICTQGGVIWHVEISLELINCWQVLQVEVAAAQQRNKYVTVVLVLTKKDNARLVLASLPSSLASLVVKLGDGALGGYSSLIDLCSYGAEF